MSTKILQVSATNDGQRLDHFLAQALTNISRKRIKQLIDAKGVSINGKAIYMAGWQLKVGQKIAVKLSDGKSSPTKKRFIAVAYEDRWLIAANKDAGLTYEEMTAEIRKYLQRTMRTDYLPFAGEVHRLDKETSGILLVARNKQTQKDLDELFRSHKIDKQYLAIVAGRVAQETGVLRDKLTKGKFARGKKVVVSEAGKQAITRFEVVERYQQATLLKLIPQTGRTHQIRVHLAAYGFPIIGDKLYGNKQHLWHTRQLLHAVQVSFKHPATGKYLKINAQPPLDFATLVDRLRLA